MCLAIVKSGAMYVPAVIPAHCSGVPVPSASVNESCKPFEYMLITPASSTAKIPLAFAAVLISATMSAKLSSLPVNVTVMFALSDS